MAQWVKHLPCTSEGLSSGPQSPCRVRAVVHSLILHSFSSVMRQEVGTGDNSPPTFEIQLTWCT